MDYKEKIVIATDKYRVETKSPEDLQKLINQMKGMEIACRSRCEYLMEKFYRNAKISYQKRLDKLLKQHN